MKPSIRRGRSEDPAVLGDIVYRAFKAIAEAHNFAPDFPNADAGAGMTGRLIALEGAYDVVAEIDGRIVGSNFLDERNPISGVGPITVDPHVQNSGIGAALMQAVIERSEQQGFAGVRLVQAGYHMRSLSLYLKLGFDAREHLSCVQGPTLGGAPPDFPVRPATQADLGACNDLCFRVHGHHRSGELADAIADGAARVVERGGRVTGYCSSIGYFGHAVGESDDDIKALIGAAEAFQGPGFLVPTSNGALMRWCLANGLRVSQSLTLMSMGLYNQPQGAWLPSIIY